MILCGWKTHPRHGVPRTLEQTARSCDASTASAPANAARHERIECQIVLEECVERRVERCVFQPQRIIDVLIMGRRPLSFPAPSRTRLRTRCSIIPCKITQRRRRQSMRERGRDRRGSAFPLGAQPAPTPCTHRAVSQLTG